MNSTEVDKEPKSFWLSFARKSYKVNNRTSYETQSTPVNKSCIIKMSHLQKSRKKVSIQDPSFEETRNEPLTSDSNLPANDLSPSKLGNLPNSIENENAILTAAQVHNSDV